MNQKAEAIAKKVNMKLLMGDIVVIGLGGVGSCLIRPLDKFMRTVDPEELRELILWDGDDFDETSNEYRTLAPGVGNKADVWADALGRGQTIDEYVTAENINGITDGDVVFLCVDNHGTRKLVSDHCRTLDNVVLISGGNDGVNEQHDGTTGTCQVFVRQGGKDIMGSPLTRFHPEIENPTDKNPADMNCLELAAAGEPQLLFANLAVASHMLNAFWRVLTCRGRMYDENVFDVYYGKSCPKFLSGPES